MAVHPAYSPVHILNLRKIDYDTSPLGEGLQAIRNNRLEDEDRAFARQQYDQQRAEKTAASEQERQMTARKFVDNALTTLDPKAADFPVRWKGMLDTLRRSGHEIGNEYDDPSIGYNLALAEVTDAKSRMNAANSERDAGLRERDISLREREADSKALSRDRNDLVRFLQTVQGADTPEKWDQQQGYIQAVYGRPVGFNDRNFVLAQAQRESSASDPFEPTYDEQRLGITREMKLESERSKRLGEMYGKKGEQKEGYRYDIVNGKVEQVPTTEKADEIKKREGIVKFHLDTLSSAEKAMTDANLAQRAWGIGMDAGEIGQAAADWENAVLGLVYERSGKQTAVAEMKQWINTYGPKAGDGAWRVKQKLSRVREFYKALVGDDMPTAKEAQGHPERDRLKSKYGLE